MNVTFACSFCGRRLTLDRSSVGHAVQCPYCNSVFTLDEEMLEKPTPRQAAPVAIARLQTQPPRGTITFDARPIGFWARVVASIVDTIVTFIVAIVTAFVFGCVIGVIGGNAEFVGQLIGICASWLYCALMEASEVQATLGKLVIGAKVVDANGDRLTFGRATGRHFAKYLSTFLLLIGYIMVAFDERKRGLHDMIAGTYVISRH